MSVCEKCGNQRDLEALLETQESDIASLHAKIAGLEKLVEDYRVDHLDRVATIKDLAKQLDIKTLENIKGAAFVAEQRAYIENLKERLFIAEGEITRLREGLVLILPMAKGYAAEHRVGSNQEFVNNVELLVWPEASEKEIK